MDQEVWTKFINGDEDVLVKLPPKIAISWQNCHYNKVDPYLQRPLKIVTNTDLKERQRKNRVLINLAKSEIKQLKANVTIRQPLFILTDNEGTILWRDGHYQARDYANEIFFNEGSRWTELDVGTNAIGMALKSEKDETLSLEEHYAISSRKWGCAASPIFDSENQVIGVLDISTYNNDSVKDVAFLLGMITQRISNGFIRDELHQKMSLLKYASTHLSNEILCDTRFKVMYLPESLRDTFQLNDDIRLHLTKETIYQKQEITLENDLLGYRFKLYEIPQVQKNFYYSGVPSLNKNYNRFLEKVQKLAHGKVPIHIYGESGSGKEVIAQTIHYNSSESNGPLVIVNCGAVSENLLESELFGYAPGAFTGAKSSGYLGKISQANKGTLFLDEVDSMSPKMQTALLRVLEEKKVTPISGKPHEVSFRLITASNQDLRERVWKKEFREDLFYRIYVGKLEIPPLRERIEDLMPLIDAFCEKKNWSISWKPTIFNVAKTFSWPGNIREFNNFLERLSIFYEEETPTEEEIREVISLGSLAKETSSKRDQEAEILTALGIEHYNVTKTAKRLGMSRATLYRKLKEYQIEY